MWCRRGRSWCACAWMLTLLLVFSLPSSTHRPASACPHLAPGVSPRTVRVGSRQLQAPTVIATPSPRRPPVACSLPRLPRWLALCFLSMHLSSSRTPPLAHCERVRFCFDFAFVNPPLLRPSFLVPAHPQSSSNAALPSDSLRTKCSRKAHACSNTRALLRATTNNVPLSSVW